MPDISRKEHSESEGASRLGISVIISFGEDRFKIIAKGFSLNFSIGAWLSITIVEIPTLSLHLVFMYFQISKLSLK